MPAVTIGRKLAARVSQLKRRIPAPDGQPANTANLAVWIHIGLAKTGTTSLQRSVFSRHSQILYLGKYWDDSYVTHPLHRLARQNPKGFDFRETRVRFEEMIGNGAETGLQKRICLLSEEALTGYRTFNPAICADRAHEMFPQANILLVLRQPIDWLMSMYFFRLGLRFPETLDGFDRWLTAGLVGSGVGTDMGILHIGAIVRKWVELQGRDRIKIMFYEEFRANAEDFVSEMGRALDIDPVEANALYQAGNKFAKSRITRRQQEFCLQFRLVRDGEYDEYVSSVLPVLECLSPKDRRQAEAMLPADLHGTKESLRQSFLQFSRFLDKSARDYLREGEPCHAELPAELAERVGAMVIPGLRYIESEFGLAMDQYIQSVL
jgi:hypothetical protein